MAEIVLFHHAQGLTEGVRTFAGELRQAGHTVHLPDSYEGNVFDTLDEGLDYAKATGFGAIAAAEALGEGELGDGLFYAGFSLGVIPAQQLAQTRAGARGALFLHGCLPVSEFSEAWPAGVPVQVHAMEQDPFFIEEDGDLDSAKALVASTSDAELFLYPGKEHLFTDSSLPAYDEAAATLLKTRVLEFLAR
ncbi:dienelactone hydrolase family protein [Streptomyces sp. SID13031]|uniref:dienelactone hydrolase family protein n=1 Tax=Streptomyces sp. SID13031 TaxID=2706046 RepID=UPI0013C7B0E8|nr:dienelactone hydrolase family protein [Streptomyces sp. SID13031]NEA33514.1 dienelactone hydrolase family protein [Streptomyces sp. SID13031]